MKFDWQTNRNTEKDLEICRTYLQSVTTNNESEFALMESSERTETDLLESDLPGEDVPESKWIGEGFKNSKTVPATDDEFFKGIKTSRNDLKLKELRIVIKRLKVKHFSETVKALSQHRFDDRRTHSSGGKNHLTKHNEEFHTGLPRFVIGF